jgi:transcription elongation factor S-II
MEPRDFDEAIRRLVRSVGKQAPADDILAQLEALQKFAAPKEEVLRSTKAGVVVNRLRHNSDNDAKITAAASALVSKWKKAVDVEKAARRAKAHEAAAAAGGATDASPKDSRPGSSSAAPTPTTTTAPVALPSTAAESASLREPFAGDPDRRSAKADGVNTARTRDDIRNNAIMMMYNGLAFRSTESCEAVLARAVAVEDAAFAAYDGTSADYKAKMRSLLLNLKNKTNRALGERVMSGDIPADRFVVMTQEELRSEEQRAKDAKMEHENMMKAHVPQEEKAIASGRECRKCKENMVTYTQAQTRSADEPMTTFFSCTICGFRWKE